MRYGFLNLIHGQFGAGKTAFAFYMAKYFYEKEGAVLITNAWSTIPHIRFDTIDELVDILKNIQGYHYNHIIPATAPDDYLIFLGLPRVGERPIKFVLLIDEAQKMFAARNFAKNFKSDELLDMLTQPRKYNMHIFAVVQRLSMLDKNFRILANYFIEPRRFLFFWNRAYFYDPSTFVVDPQNFASLDQMPKALFSEFFKIFKKKPIYYTGESVGARAVKDYDRDKYDFFSFISENDIKKREKEFLKISKFSEKDE